MKKYILSILAIVLASTASFAAEWQMKQGPMMTPWAEKIDPACPLPEYPRPQMVRDNWMNLNGIWDLRKGVVGEAYSASFNYDQAILVPYPLESALSGVMEKSDEQCYWYRRTFDLPEAMKGKDVLLNFGAVDWECIAYVNGQQVGRHTGGYDPFSFNITSAIDPAKAQQELVVYIYDNTGVQGQPTGKQSKNPSICWYTANSGIWQTVWIEAVNPVHIAEIEMEPNLDRKWLSLVVTTSQPATVQATVRDREGNTVGTVSGESGAIIRVEFSDVHPWSPEDPYLYDVELTASVNGTVSDKVKSYCGIRKIEVKKVDGLPRIFVNNKQIFQLGPLDQGFWPDGIYTPPTDEALLYDIEVMKDLGFNMVRKHIKVEPARWYYHCDREGLLVWQDLPSGNVVQGYEEQAKANFRDESVRIVKALKNYPSIVHWVVFNEGWGQFDTNSVTTLVDGQVNRISPIRFGRTSLICCASGWTDSEIGQVIDTHSYPYPSCPSNANRAAVCGEYGGITLKVPGHIWPGGDFQYTVVETPADFTAYFNMLCDRIMDFYYTGLNAAVYTQIADVEIEKNGILTYDRKVFKPANVDRLRAKIAEVINMPHNEIIIKPIISTTREHTYNWRYMTNANPPRHWFATEFDDSSWAEGPAAFGAGVPAPHNSLVKTSWNTPQIFMRRWFYINDLSPENIAKLRFMAFHDDDIDIYINGVLAASQSGCNFNYSPIDLSEAGRAAIKPGEWNLIAVAGKQGGGQQIMDVGLYAFTQTDFDYTESFDSRTDAPTGDLPTPGTASNPTFKKVLEPVTNESSQTGSGSNLAAKQFVHTNDRSDVAWGDYNNDGLMDLVYSGHNNHRNNDGVWLYENQGNYTFRRVSNSMAACFYASPVWIDFNNDGLLDLFMPGLKNRNYSNNLDDIAAFFYVNRGGGVFEEVNLATNDTNAIGIDPIYNSRDGGRGRHWASAGDFNNDGWTDLVVIGRDDYASEETDAQGNPIIMSDNRVLYIYKNVAGERFELLSTPLEGTAAIPGLSRGSVHFADFDNDGLLDIMASGYGELEGNLNIYWNNGNETFTAGTRLIGAHDSSCVPADFDADGMVDIFCSGFANLHTNGSAKSMYIYRNVGNRNFALLEDDFCGFEGVDGATPSIADVNTDGLPDVLTGGHGEEHEITTWLYVNQGDFSFKPYGVYYNNPFGKSFEFDRVSHGNSHLVDVNNDGMLDAWSAGWAHSSDCPNECASFLYSNNTKTVNTAPSAPSNLAVSYDKGTGRFIFSWKGATDDVTPAAALRYNIYIKKAGSDKVFMTIPADVATGRLKVGITAQAANTNSYVMTLPLDNAEYEWGVQTIDNGNLGSSFTTGSFKASAESGVAIVNSDNISVNTCEGDILYSLAGIDANVTLYDAEGRLLAVRNGSEDGSFVGFASSVYMVSIVAPGLSRVFKIHN